VWIKRLYIWNCFEPLRQNLDGESAEHYLKSVWRTESLHEDDNDMYHAKWLHDIIDDSKYQRNSYIAEDITIFSFEKKKKMTYKNGKFYDIKYFLAK
jgi:DNA relaxase NicK